MTDQPIHRLYRHFQELPTSMRVLFTCALLVLGLGYLFGLLYVFNAHAGRDGNPGMSVDDIIITYSGSADGTQLESALRGPMSGMIPSQELGEIIRWIQSGADKAGYEDRISVILDESCLSCHDGSNPHLTNLDGFENLQQVVKQDTGADLHTLVRVSHIHLFGLTFIFFIVGFIFSHAYLRPVFKSTVMATPFVAVIMDVSSWYFTKLFQPFGWVVLIAGGMMGLSFAVMWFVSMYQMWIYRVPDHVRDRNGDQT
jgi:hypothetical protein